MRASSAQEAMLSGYYVCPPNRRGLWNGKDFDQAVDEATGVRTREGDSYGSAQPVNMLAKTYEAEEK